MPLGVKKDNIYKDIFIVGKKGDRPFDQCLE